VKLDIENCRSSAWGCCLNYTQWYGTVMRFKLAWLYFSRAFPWK